MVDELCEVGRLYTEMMKSLSDLQPKIEEIVEKNCPLCNLKTDCPVFKTVEETKRNLVMTLLR